MRYLARNSYGYYSFRIRIPVAYRMYFNQTEIIKALKTKSYNEARKLCKLVTAETLKLLQTLKLGIFNENQEKSLVNEYMSKVLAKENQAEPFEEEKAVTQTKMLIVEEKPKETQSKSVEEIVTIYLKNIPHTTSETSKKAYKAFFEDILFELIDKDMSIEDIDREKLLEVREIVQALPKRNIQKYRNMKVSKIISRANVKDDEKIGMKTINDYLQWTTSLFIFAQKYGYIRFNPAVNLKFKVKNNAKEQRDIFSDDELKKFVTHNQEEENIKLFHYTLFYTGMINSEFLQAKISEVDGVLCFDLTNPDLKLKTLARHRLIPIHSHLLKLGIVDKLAYIQKNYTTDYLSRFSSKFINKNISDSSKKVLYSFYNTPRNQESKNQILIPKKLK